jgi:hypothetical protein
MISFSESIRTIFAGREEAHQGWLCADVRRPRSTGRLKACRVDATHKFIAAMQHIGNMLVDNHTAPRRRL